MAAEDLTDLATVYIAAGMPDSTPETDQILGTLITNLSAYVPQVLERGVLAADYVETYEGNGKEQMLLRQRPVGVISSIAWLGQAITAPGDPVAGTIGIWTDGRNACLQGYCFPKGATVRISYRAGYETVPADLSYAVAELVAEAYARRQHVGESSRANQGVVTVSFDMKAMHNAIADKLSSYRRGAPC